MLNKHIENKVTLKLRLIQEYNPKIMARETKLKEFNQRLFSEHYGHYFKSVPFFHVDVEEFLHATKGIDQWITDFYKKDRDVIEKYEKYDTLPDNLEKDLPIFLKPYWEILTKVNQNKWCKVDVLARPIPGFEDVEATIFSGFKVNGLKADMKQYYIILTLKGKTQDVDLFISPYRLK